VARLALKPDASFFRKIAAGVVGVRAVVFDMAQQGHELVELERGAADMRIWKDVKRKRVRIPDLVCLRCGTRIECRAKTKPELSMSHSATEAERAWDFGMVDGDWIAFPVCLPVENAEWSRGRLGAAVSYWRERSWVRWKVAGCINYFPVAGFRSGTHGKGRRKGVTEGSENFIAWEATFSNRDGTVVGVDTEARKVTVRRDSDGHSYTWRVKQGQQILVAEGQRVRENQVIASAVPCLSAQETKCRRNLSCKHIQRLLESREMMQRFTGVKLARLRVCPSHESAIAASAGDSEEDVYVRLESAAYLAVVCRHQTASLFTPYLQNCDPQLQLEAVITLGEVGTEEAVDLLSAILNDLQQPYFLRSAAAWSLRRIGTQKAIARLVAAFSDVDLAVREEALEGLVALGEVAHPALMHGLRDADISIAAGCAEAIRQQGVPTRELFLHLVDELRCGNPGQWVIWLVGHLPRDQFASVVAEFQHRRPELHYAIVLLWSFVESWIGRHWELNPDAHFPDRGCNVPDP